MLLTGDDDGSVRLELGVDVDDDPIGDDGLEIRPPGDVLPSELVDPTPVDVADPDRLDPDTLDPDKVDPDNVEEPLVVEVRLDGEVDESDVPLVPIEEPGLVDSGLPLALVSAEDGGLVALRLLLPMPGLLRPELEPGLQGCGSDNGSGGGSTGDVWLCIDVGV